MFDRSNKIRVFVYFCLDMIVVFSQTVFCGIRQFWHEPWCYVTLSITCWVVSRVTELPLARLVG
jgi:hypothetical protein